MGRQIPVPPLCAFVACYMANFVLFILTESNVYEEPPTATSSLLGEERETNKMQLIRCLLSNFYLKMFRAPLCPSSGEQDSVLLRMVFCTVTRGGKT